MKRIAFLLFAFAIALTTLTLCENGSTVTTKSDSTKVAPVKIDSVKAVKVDTVKVKADSAVKSRKARKPRK
jgi:hypothetical protein